MKNGAQRGAARRYLSETMFIFSGHVATSGGPRLADATLRFKLFICTYILRHQHEMYDLILERTRSIRAFRSSRRILTKLRQIN